MIVDCKDEKAGLTVKATSLRVGDEVRFSVAGVFRWVRVLKMNNTPEHVRFVADKGDMIVDPGRVLTIKRRAALPLARAVFAA